MTMSMTTMINERGSLTLPEELRRQCGLQAPSAVELVATAEGLLIRPSRRYPVEDYTDERVVEFDINNEVALREHYQRPQP